MSTTLPLPVHNPNADTIVHNVETGDDKKLHNFTTATTAYDIVTIFNFTASLHRDPDQAAKPVNACLNTSICINTPGSFSCHCAEGWSGDHCDIDVDECENDVGGTTEPACQNRGKCSNSVGSFTCQCEEPWTGKRCNDPREVCSADKCANGGTCIAVTPSGISFETPPPLIVLQSNSISPDGRSFYCVCQRGWHGPKCLSDRNECLMEPCGNEGQCINEVGGFQCQCLADNNGKCGNDTGYDNAILLSVLDSLF